MTRRFVLAPIVFAGALMFAGGAVLRADDDCQKRTIAADHNLHKAIEKNGPQTRKPNIGAPNWRLHVPTAGNTTIAGGMRIRTPGAASMIGTTTITTIDLLVYP